MKNTKLNEYLELKGFTAEDLFSNHAVIMDDEHFVLADSGEPWLSSVVAVNEETNKPVTAQDILYKKQTQYQMEGCTAAIFVPLFRLSGDFVGLAIRKMHETKHDSWFVPGSRKIDLIYNLNNAFEHCAKKNAIILTEGCYDTIALRKYGILNCGALLGTHMSNLQFFQLFATVDNVALCLDNDEAGINAVKKIVTTYKGKMNFFRVNIDKDPDEFLKEHGVEEFKKRIIQI